MNILYTYNNKANSYSDLIILLIIYLINKHKMINYISVRTQGRLGNHLFIIISGWAYAKKNGLEFVLDNSYIYSFNKYYNNFFNKMKLTNTHSISFRTINYDIFEDISNKIYEPNTNIIINGYLQNSNNFEFYREEVLEIFFNIPRNVINPNNNFFIHIRLTDFVHSPAHYINLEKYYLNAITYIKYKIDFTKTTFYIISDDIKTAKEKDYLKLLPSENIIYLDNNIYDEFKTFDIFKNCYLGGIIGNSTYAWWGAYVINNPNKIIVCPNKFLNQYHDYSGLYMNYKVLDV